jgi:hypothetical protein
MESDISRPSFASLCVYKCLKYVVHLLVAIALATWLLSFIVGPRVVAKINRVYIFSIIEPGTIYVQVDVYDRAAQALSIKWFRNEPSIHGVLGQASFGVDIPPKTEHWYNFRASCQIPFAVVMTFLLILATLAARRFKLRLWECFLLLSIVALECSVYLYWVE